MTSLTSAPCKHVNRNRQLVIQNLYRTVVALNNIGVSLLNKLRFCDAISTFSDAMMLLKTIKELAKTTDHQTCQVCDEKYKAENTVMSTPNSDLHMYLSLCRVTEKKMLDSAHKRVSIALATNRVSMPIEGEYYTTFRLVTISSEEDLECLLHLLSRDESSVQYCLTMDPIIDDAWGSRCYKHWNIDAATININLGVAHISCSHFFEQSSCEAYAPTALESGLYFLKVAETYLSSYDTYLLFESDPYLLTTSTILARTMTLTLNLYPESRYIHISHLYHTHYMKLLSMIMSEKIVARSLLRKQHIASAA
jgi:hypothetical protein